MPKNALAQVLLDFSRTPGRYALRLREPQELYAEFDTVALWAQGRMPDALQAQSQALKAAAVLFIQRACFAQDSNHYQILGLLPGPVDAELLRARYRSMIRLTHPDMGVEGLPSGAAGMVNRAQKVLADPELREQYDQQLEANVRPSWQGIPAAPGPSSANLRSLERRQLDRHHPGGLGERWSALWARYPTQLRLLLTTFGVGALVVALLAWAANDAPGGALVVARAPAQPPQLNRTAAKPESPVRTLANKSEDQSVALGLSRDWGGAAPAPKAPKAPALRTDAPAQRTPAISPARMETPATPLPELVAAATARARPALERPLAQATPLPAPREEETKRRPMPGSRQAADAIALPASRETARAPSTASGAERTAAAPQAPPIAPTQPAPYSAPAAPASPAATAVAAQAVATAPSPAPAPPAAAQWSVDVPGATLYVRDLMTLIERPQEASRTQDLLRSMNVKGNLLAPGLRLARDYPQLRVNAVALSETRRPGALELRGTVRVQAEGSAGSTTVQYRVAAHFVGMEGGTALTRLDLLEGQ